MTAARSKTPTTRAHTQAQCSVEIGDAEEGISGIQRQQQQYQVNCHRFAGRPSTLISCQVPNRDKDTAVKGFGARKSCSDGRQSCYFCCLRVSGRTPCKQMRQRRKRELFARDKLLPRHARSVSFLSNKKKGHGIRQSIFSVPFPKSLKAAFPIRMIVAAELQQHLLQCETLPSADSIIWLWHSWVCDGEIPALPSGVQGVSTAMWFFL